MSRNPRRAGVLVAGAVCTVGLALAGCGGGSSSADPSPTGGDQAGGAASGAPVKNGVSQVHVTMTSEGGAGRCAVDHATAKAGPVTFTVANKSATGITELELQSNGRIIGEKENLAPGLAPVKFTVTLQGGEYKIYCPGAKKEMQAFTVTGKTTKKSGSTGTLLAQGTKGYGKYVSGVIGDMVTAAQNLQKAVDSGSVDQAKAKYALARPFYEKIESDVDGFVLPGFKATDNAGNLDYLIDMRASNMDPKVGWHGFHAIERDLFKNGKITAGTKKQAKELVSNVKKLEKLSKGLTYKPEDLANGAAGLLEEVQSTKVTGEEEAYSHIDLVDMAANVEGSQQAFAFLKPGLKKIDPALTKKIAARFTAVNTKLDAYRDPKAPGGYTAWTPQLRKKAAPDLSKAVQSLQDPLSHLAEKVATAQ